MRKRQKGFSLIELLIVVAIILIIAAIAIPNLLRARMAANESSAVGSLRTLNTAMVEYQSACPASGYASSLNFLGPTSTPACGTAENMVDDILSGESTNGTATSFQKSGYTFAFTPGSGTPLTTYSITAAPLTANQTGVRYFFTDQTAVIRYNGTAAATGADQPIQ
jgi:prepilin-type N-terminal cleavage/methylation domain-containing protein